ACGKNRAAHVSKRPRGRRLLTCAALIGYRFYFFSASATNLSIASSSALPPGEPTYLWRMTPLWSRVDRGGQPRTCHSAEIGPPVPLGPFQNERQVICSFSFFFLQSSRSLSLLTPIRAKGLPSSRFTSDRSWGNIARHGGHQCPQKSSRTTLPR